MSKSTDDEVVAMLAPVVTLADEKARSAREAGRARRRRHLYARDAADAAREMGVQVRALCGFWLWPNKVPGRDARLGEQRNCLRCEASAAKLLRKHGRG